MRGPLKVIAAVTAVSALLAVVGCTASSPACHSINRPHVHAGHDIILFGSWPSTTFEKFALDAPDPERRDAPAPTLPPG